MVVGSPRPVLHIDALRPRLDLTGPVGPGRIRWLLENPSIPVIGPGRSGKLATGIGSPPKFLPKLLPVTTI